MKTLVILSGGMDSAVLLAYVIDSSPGKWEDVEALNFSYGSKHNAEERESAEAIVSEYGIPLHLCDLDFVGKLFKSDLLKSGGSIPEGHYEAASMASTVVPFRNSIMLSIACGVAESRGLQRVAYGAHAGDHRIYPDCRSDFVEAFNKMALLSSEGKVSIFAPFLEKSKTDLVVLGDSMGLPFDLTYSCYKGGPVHCGVCATCVERREAFYKAVVKDPTIYEVSWEETVKIGGLKL